MGDGDCVGYEAGLVLMATRYVESLSVIEHQSFSS